MDFDSMDPLEKGRVPNADFFSKWFKSSIRDLVALTNEALSISIAQKKSIIEGHRVIQISRVFRGFPMLQLPFQRSFLKHFSNKKV